MKPLKELWFSETPEASIKQCNEVDSWRTYEIENLDNAIRFQLGYLRNHRVCLGLQIQ